MQNYVSKVWGFLVACGPWPICCAVLFFVLVKRGDNLASLLIAASGAAALPMLSDTFRRYGISSSQQFKVSLTAAGASCAVFLAFPTDSRADTAAPEATTPAQDTSSEPVEPDSKPVESIPTIEPEVRTPDNLQPLYNCVAKDGDTLSCNGEDIRLLGVDAPEMPGHCRIGRLCAPGNPYSAKSSLSMNLTGPLYIERVGGDRFQRTLAVVYGSNGNLSCIQLATGNAIYDSNWDDGGRIATDCGLSAYAP